MLGSRCVGGDIVTLRRFGGQFVRRGVEGGREGGTWLLGCGLGGDGGGGGNDNYWYVLSCSLTANDLRRRLRGCFWSNADVGLAATCRYTYI